MPVLWWVPTIRPLVASGLTVGVVVSAASLGCEGGRGGQRQPLALTSAKAASFDVPTKLRQICARLLTRWHGGDRNLASASAVGDTLP